MANINRLKVGQEVWSVEKAKMGHTSISYNALYSVIITEINIDDGWVMARWNTNRPQKFFNREIKKWRVNKPEPKANRYGMDCY
jgi:hypothetical protein